MKFIIFAVCLFSTFLMGFAIALKDCNAAFTWGLASLLNSLGFLFLLKNDYPQSFEA